MEYLETSTAIGVRRAHRARAEILRAGTLRCPGDPPTLRPDRRTASLSGGRAGGLPLPPGHHPAGAFVEMWTPGGRLRDRPPGPVRDRIARDRPMLMAMERWRSADAGRPLGGAVRAAARGDAQAQGVDDPPLPRRPLRRRGGAVAWVTSGFPVEMLRPLGFPHGLPGEPRRDLLGEAEGPRALRGRGARGYSRDLCGYARADLGASPRQDPVGRLPRPDLLCCCTNICQTVLYWYGRWRPISGTAGGHRHPLRVRRSAAAPPGLRRRPITGAHGNRRTGRRRKVDRANWSRRCGWPARRRACGTNACAPGAPARPPGPVSTPSSTSPPSWRCADAECNAYYRMLRDELDDRVARGVGGVSDERVRLLWDNLPICSTCETSPPYLRGTASTSYAPPTRTRGPRRAR